MSNDYNELLSSVRKGAGVGKNRKNIDASYSDRTRILYCSSFRRLQQKAQVFSMETNSSVRSRLTHSLEVSDLGRRLANGIAYSLKNKGCLTDTNIPVLVSVVENACLLHDIGNPPFGHFCESAIQDWAQRRAMDLSPEDWTEVKDGVRQWLPRIGMLMKDFEEFDGNPQGFRTVTKLYSDFGPNGLDLTYATLLCGLKYARTTGEPKKRGDKKPGILKKAGWFRTEHALVEEIHKEVKRPLGTRYPLTYIMEAADDISYCMSDIADGIEKRILTEEDFVRVFAQEWDKKWNPERVAALEALKKEDKEKREQTKKGLTKEAYKKRLTALPPRNHELPEEINKYLDNPEDMVSFNHDFAVPWSTKATEAALNAFEADEEAIWRGDAEPLMDRDCEMHKVLKTITEVCCKLLYPSIEAESIELTGYAVITGILRHYERLMKLPMERFEDVMGGNRMDYPVESRLYNRIGGRCVDAYNEAMKEVKSRGLSDQQLRQEEWWLRVHLLIDHISSMTDAFALETYQMLEGIALMRT